MTKVPLLVDTTVWINFFAGKSNQSTAYLNEYIADFPQFISICHVNLQEILQGIRSDRDFVHIRGDILNFNILDFDPIADSTEAASLYRHLRKKGKTVRKSNDCLIAHLAIKNDMTLFHSDRDFKIIGQHTALKEISFLK